MQLTQVLSTLLVLLPIIVPASAAPYAKDGYWRVTSESIAPRDSLGDVKDNAVIIRGTVDNIDNDVESKTTTAVVYHY